MWGLYLAGFDLRGFIHDELIVQLPEANDYRELAEAVDRMMCAAMEEFTGTVPIATEYAICRKLIAFCSLTLSDTFLRKRAKHCRITGHRYFVRLIDSARAPGYNRGYEISPDEYASLAPFR